MRIKISADKEALKLFFSKELLEYFDLALVQELGQIEANEDFMEIVFEEKNIFTRGIFHLEYESKGFIANKYKISPYVARLYF